MIGVVYTEPVSKKEKSVAESYHLRRLPLEVAASGIEKFWWIRHTAVGEKKSPQILSISKLFFVKVQIQLFNINMIKCDLQNKSDNLKPNK